MIIFSNYLCLSNNGTVGWGIWRRCSSALGDNAKVLFGGDGTQVNMEMNLEMAPRCRCLGALEGAFEDDARMQSEVHLVIMPGS
jgi:hypothetical protein